MTNNEIISATIAGMNKLAEIGHHAATVHNAECIDAALVEWSADFVRFVSEISGMEMSEIVEGIIIDTFGLDIGDVTDIDFPMGDERDPRDIGY